MDVRDRVVVVTGGASGIGKALCERFARDGARAVVVADRDRNGAERVARDVSGLAVEVDVGRQEQIARLVQVTTERFGRVDLFCSNAGILVEGGPETADADWGRAWNVNVMAHVYAARVVIPQMLERGEGYLLTTASAAGLLSQIGAAPYAVTKHAAVAFAEWLAITYGERGIRVSCLCPQGVRTNMLNEASGPSFLLEGALSAEAVADAVVAGLAAEQFLILPHPEVKTYFERKSADPDRWIRGMQRLRARFSGG